MKYSTIIADMTWSYSRITAFEFCPYGWLMKYLKPVPQKRLFFSDYGKFIHSLIATYLKGGAGREALTLRYLTGFRKHVPGAAPSRKVYSSYFHDGLHYMGNISFPYEKVLALEEQQEFSLDGVPFVGIPDIVATDADAGLVIVDNKARKLKGRSARSKPTKADQELDEFLRQLYLYAKPVSEKYGETPRYLDLNCYRSGQIIREPFNKQVFERVKEWARRQIDKIIENGEWSPNVEYFKCRYLCDVSDSCEYFKMTERRGI